MKRRLFKSILHVPYGCGWTAICEENKAWHLPAGAAEWVELPELPPIEELAPQMAPATSPEPPVCQDLSNMAAIIDRAERLLNMSSWKRAAANPCPDVTDIIDISYAVKSLIEEIRNELGLPKPSEAA